MVMEISNMDEELFESFYHRFFGKVFRFLLHHTRDNQEAEDLTHDVFLKFWNYRASFSETIPPDAQLLVIAKQVVINRYRREVLKKAALADREAEARTSYDETEVVLREAEASEELKKALDCLPPRRREIFEKSRFQVMSYEEIAADMGISKNTVESQMVKALKFLRERLAHLTYLLLFLFLPMA